MIISLQALRFIFALFVFVEHFPVSAEETSLLHGAGPMGVSFFIVLSGFVMSIGYEKRVQEPTFSWKDFMIKRLIRLWPLHLLCLGAWIILAYGAWGSSAIYPLPLLGNALLLQWLPIEHIEGNSVAWCLSVLVIFYAVYPFIAHLKTCSLLLFGIGLGVLLHVLVAIYPSMDTNAYWYFSPASRLLDFLLGMIVFRFYQRALLLGWAHKWSLLPSMLRWGIESLPFLLYVAALLYLRFDYTYINSVVLFYLPSFLVIFLFALVSNSEEKVGIPALLSQRWLIYLGEVSFSFYMVHNLVILTVKKGLEYFAPATPWEVRLVISLIGAIVAGILVNRFFEVPVANRLSKLFSAKR